MSMDKLIAESGAASHLSNEALCDIKNLAKTFMKQARRRSVDCNEEYCFKIAAGIFGNWEWQLKRAKEKGENKLNLWTPTKPINL